MLFISPVSSHNVMPDWCTPTRRTDYIMLVLALKDYIGIKVDATLAQLKCKRLQPELSHPLIFHIFYLFVLIFPSLGAFKMREQCDPRSPLLPRLHSCLHLPLSLLLFHGSVKSKPWNAPWQLRPTSSPGIPKPGHCGWD